ncbi:hypothetical protein DES40_1647 [Litorimonas taeanensis]|uniref:Uncharacterized protein n=1 Tax=Litorimonas taeanensis TaxID=568099 RepID=A0A420WDA5_9PROT|nr:hypothetical protein [Litorimonas taeanensis]RKQ68872.1 hypothetical protein DES40_1647 [Litorimonas taeanensis]
MDSAIWALIGVVIGTILSGVISYALQKSQFNHEKEMFDLENKSLQVVKALLKEMLNHKGYTDRSFDALKQPIGGYSDDEIRQLLHEIDAQRIERNGEEWWFLRSRKEERIEHLRDKKAKRKVE